MLDSNYTIELEALHGGFCGLYAELPKIWSCIFAFSYLYLSTARLYWGLFFFMVHTKCNEKAAVKKTKKAYLCAH